jgi:hypothetical protein
VKPVMSAEFPCKFHPLRFVFFFKPWLPVSVKWLEPLVPEPLTDPSGCKTNSKLVLNVHTDLGRLPICLPLSEFEDRAANRISYFGRSSGARRVQYSKMICNIVSPCLFETMNPFVDSSAGVARGSDDLCWRATSRPECPDFEPSHVACCRT